MNTCTLTIKMMITGPADSTSPHSAPSVSTMFCPGSSLLNTLLIFSSCTTLSYSFTFLIGISGDDQLDTLLHLPSGDIQGKISKSRDGKDFASFEGVPYAEAPVRWMPPEPKASWDGTLDCTKPGPVCLQTDYVSFTTIGSEDCLSMNIYTTSTDLNMDGDGLPVIVFLHGGGMIQGAGEYYQGDFLVDHGVILITMNYRLDVLGFFSLDSPRVSGNQALRDVQLALRWVKENIQYFGGDPERVIISGQSGGSWATSMIYTSPLSESLFSGAIFESGVALGELGYPYSSREEALAKSKILAEKMDCYSKENEWNSEEVEQCMREKSAEEILLAGFEAQVSWASNGNIDSFSEHGSVLPLPLEDILRQGLFQKVHLMVGTSSQEELVNGIAQAADPTILDGYDEDAVWDTVGVATMFVQKSLFNWTDTCDVKYANMAKYFYFGDKLDKDDLVSYLNFGSDAKFLYPTHKYMNYMSSSQVPVYNYRMSFQDNTSFSFAPGTVGLGLGTVHGDELPYIFKIDPSYYDIPYTGWSPDNLRHSRRMCQLWANFAHFGNPTPDEGSEVLGDFKWENYESENPKFMDLGLELEMMADPDLEKRMSFWEETLADYGSEQC